MKVTVNGDRLRLDRSSSVDELVEQLGCGRRGVAVAVNEAVVPRSCWADHVLSDGDRIEVLRAVQGG